jgi:hypothetical protein
MPRHVQGTTLIRRTLDGRTKCREQERGRRVGVRRAMMPEHGEAYVVIRARVIHVQRAAVAQLEIRLSHGSGVVSEPRRRSHPASAVDGEPKLDIPPSRKAIPLPTRHREALSRMRAFCLLQRAQRSQVRLSPLCCGFSLAAARLLSRWRCRAWLLAVAGAALVPRSRTAWSRVELR